MLSNGEGGEREREGERAGSLPSLATLAAVANTESALAGVTPNGRGRAGGGKSEGGARQIELRPVDLKLNVVVGSRGG